MVRRGIAIETGRRRAVVVVVDDARPLADVDMADGDADVVALLAGVVEAAALHLEGDNVGRAVVVQAAHLAIEVRGRELREVLRAWGIVHIYVVPPSWRRLLQNHGAEDPPLQRRRASGVSSCRPKERR